MLRMAVGTGLVGILMSFVAVWLVTDCSEGPIAAASHGTGSDAADIVRSSSLITTGSWLELQSSTGEWEKITVVLRSTARESEAACVEIMHVSAANNPPHIFRCVPATE